ncbi:MAG: DUF4173 domain-containing protein [Leptospirales bacterium]|jgi:hypothetical protein
MNDQEHSGSQTAPESYYRPGRNPLAILFGALGLAFACDHLFYGHLPGISVAIFFSLYVGVFFAVAFYNRVDIRPGNLWPLPFFFYFAAMVMVRENEFLTVINVLAVASGALFLPFYLAAGALHKIGLLGGALIPVRVGRATLFSAVHLKRQFQEHREYRSAQNAPAGNPGAKAGIAAHWGGVLRGILLALPVLLVFGALLASADQIFAEILARIFSIEILDWILRTIGGAFRIAVLTWLAAGALVYALLRRPAQPETTRFEDDIHGMTKMLGLAFVETVTVLTLVNLLFAAFVLIQIGYLFGGVEYISTTEGFTYSDYARSGFFELVVTAVLSLIFVLATQRLGRRHAGAQTRWFNASIALLLVFVLVLLVSAYRRMALYEATFGYTELRLLVYLFIAWLAALLVWMIGVTLLNRSEFAIVGMVGAALGFLTTLNAINPDAFIVERNVERHVRLQRSFDLRDPATANVPGVAGEPAITSGDRGPSLRGVRPVRDRILDISYLDSLSNDAVPELLRARLRLESDPAAAAQIERSLQRRQAEIRQAELNYQMDQSSRPDWQSYHYGRERSRELLKDFAREPAENGGAKRGNSSDTANERR